jgi:type III secretory pathway component EscS
VIDPAVLVQLAQQALLLAAVVSAPIVICAALVGVGIGIVQTIFSVQDASLSHAFRAGSVFVLLIVISGWAGRQVFDFATRLFEMIG